MGTRDVRPQGFPKNFIRGSDFSFSPGCGGSGAGACYNPAAYRYMWWRVFPTNFAVKNRRLILQNISFKSYLDAGSDGFCAHSNGASQNYDVLLCYQQPRGDVLDPAQVKSRTTISAGATLPFYIDFADIKMPQPADALWGGLIYVVIDLGATGRMVDGRVATSTAMKTTNYDYDERL
jgi:hypothetical protein